MGRKGSMDPEKFSVENHAQLPIQMDMSLLFFPIFFNQCPNEKSRNQIKLDLYEKSPSWRIKISIIFCIKEPLYLKYSYLKNGLSSL